MNRSNLIALEIKLSKTVWEAVYEAEDVDDKVSIFNGVVTQALDVCMRLKSIRMLKQRLNLDNGLIPVVTWPIIIFCVQRLMI